MKTLTRAHRGSAPRRIVIVGGGYAGFYTAWQLEKRLRPGEATVTVVDPLPYMTYQPFLPEVLAGSIEARHAVISLRRHLRRTRVVNGAVTSIDHDRRTAYVHLTGGGEVPLEYDEVVVTAGSITRTFPVPGIPDEAIGLKRIEEAVAIRDTLLSSLDIAADLPPGPDRDRLLTVTFVGGGFAGVEGFAELLSLARAVARKRYRIDPAELRFHLVEAAGRILPEVSPSVSVWVAKRLTHKGAAVHLGTTVTSVCDGVVDLSSGERFESGLIVWTAGIAANPVIAKRTDLPTNARGLIVVRPDLQVGTDEAPVPGAWAAGDAAAVPDLAVGGSAVTVPNAQHAVRQGKRLAKNLAAVTRGRRTRPYRHGSLGVIATLGLGDGVFESGPVVLKGFLAWVVHRGYHVLAIPTWERKLRVLAVWGLGAFLGRDIVSLRSVQQPGYGFRHEGQVWYPDTRRRESEELRAAK
ncbi:NAD(P)/FAD-dependent oxidoreductase [Nocardioides sp. CER19]|uniref:NAD(P)/FAD-dependent oxidoreductase n=1 Tax=Nocardioides sp. CER19 TaxID=3038538 RepID=UPI002449534A|nr:NAD(P)/FAD-dependent oxidoreductase [Nocardioides sp. CER19]MDH2414434.1 NAD(P)/FAD-dependent oxidoreductase [Nocardioides sp. CER19]